MGQTDALSMVESVRRRLVDLAIHNNAFHDERLNQICRSIWSGPPENGGLISDLWVEGAFPAKTSGETLTSLSQKGFFPNDFCEYLDQQGVFPKNRSLYNHQVDALEKSHTSSSSAIPSLVITAGTGSGKTEAFLFPILRLLWNTPRQRTDGGMRCLILYPMNALVADQAERLYNWLKGQNKIRLFHFTSETPEDKKKADDQEEPKWEYCRPRTRQEARGVVDANGHLLDERPPAPDIVITNYSMLEYMLCRPQDRWFFGSDLRCIVLDEAHLYSGTLAAEITLLLRRVRERCGVVPENLLQIATSATLGGNDDQLQAFAAKLFSTSKQNTYVIRGERAMPDIPSPGPDYSDKCAIQKLAEQYTVPIRTLNVADELLTDEQDTGTKLREILDSLIDPDYLGKIYQKYLKIPANFLFYALSHSSRIHLIRAILFEKQFISLKELSEQIWKANGKDAENATALLLRLSAAARTSMDSAPVIPHRLHFLARTPEPLSVCLDPNCTGPIAQKFDRIGCVQPAADSCRYCGTLTLDLFRCAKCGQEILLGYHNIHKEVLERGDFKQPDELLYYLLHQAGDENKEMFVDLQSRECSQNRRAGTILYKIETQDKQYICPKCKTPWTNVQTSEDESREKTCVSIDLNESLALSVLGETMLFHLPPWPNDQRMWKPGEGRRMLCFSDSRKDAARLGPILSYNHEWWLLRKAMADTLKEADNTQYRDYYSKKVKDLEKQLQDAPSILHSRIEKDLEEARYSYQSSLRGLSFDDFVLKLNEHKSLEQFHHRESGEKHKAENWGQKEWESNAKRIKGAVALLAAKEFASTSLSYDGLEAMGLVEIVYPGTENLSPPPDLLGKFRTSSQRKKFNEIWPDLTALLLDTARRQGCLAWSGNIDNRRWEDQPTLPARWCSESQYGWNLVAFIGDQRRQMITRHFRLWFLCHVLNACGIETGGDAHLEAECLSAVFHQLHQKYATGEFEWLRFDNRQTNRKTNSQLSFQLLLDKLTLRRPLKIYRCKNTGTFWPRHVLKNIPLKNHGEIEEVDAEDADKDNRWGRIRRELSDPIFSMGLWGEEHSAQLSPHENRRLQNLFKSGIRNILSSTTTMELGIDIGGLNGVLLGNVPPSRANHLQRAGRAGRRSDGSAVVATFARRRRYDHDVFLHFGDFLGFSLRIPRVFLDRENISQRHLKAWLLGEFMPIERATGAMDAFGWMGGWMGITTPPYWGNDTARKPEWNVLSPNLQLRFCEFLENKKNDTIMLSRIEPLVINTPLESLSDVDKWHEFLDNAIKEFSKAMSIWSNDVQNLQMAWESVQPSPSIDERSAVRAQANAIRYQLKARCEITLIEWLANERFLPRYGFPINLQRLNVRVPSDDRTDRSIKHENYRLERSSMLAISEYIPGSEVLAGGKILVSRGIMKHWTGENIKDALGLNQILHICENKHSYFSATRGTPCPECNAQDAETPMDLMFPRFGYSTAAWDPPQRGTGIERVGKMVVFPSQETFTHSEKEDFDNEFEGISGLTVFYVDDAELLLYNSGANEAGFAVCTLCGYAESEDKIGSNLPKGFSDHASIYHPNPTLRCWGKNQTDKPVLRNRVIAAREHTEMILLRWPRALNIIEAYSIGKALQLAGCRKIEVDPREVGVKPKNITRENYEILLFDTTPGGSGHCREFKQLGREWLVLAREILTGTQKHQETCNHACLNCILDYDSWFYAEHLDRLAALEALDRILA